MCKKKYYICVTPFFPSPSDWRGAYVLDQVKAIKRNSDYEIVVFMGGNQEDEYSVEGIRVYRYKMCSLPSNILNGIFNKSNASSFLKRVSEVGLDIGNVAVVHCHVAMQAACGLALKQQNHNIKVVLQHHDLDPFNLRSGVQLRNCRWNIRFRAKKALQLYNEVDVHICISEACKDSLLSFPHPRKGEVYGDCLRALALCDGLHCVKPKAVYVLYNGVNTSLFVMDGEQHHKKSLFRIGCISNFNELKDHITLIRSFRKLVEEGRDNLRLILLGSGEMRPMCEQYISEHGLNRYVEWHDEVAHDRLPDFYRTLDLFVLPSYFEGFGCVFTEAAACGVPFMGCKNQGYSEYIPDDEKDQWLIEPHDYERLAELIGRYIEERPVQHYCHTFDIDALVKEYLDYLNTL